MKLETSKFIQFRLDGVDVLVECLLTRKIFKLSSSVKSVLEYFKNPNTEFDAKNKFSNQFSENSISLLVNELIELKILRYIDDEDYKENVYIAKKLSSCGWDKDFKFHQLSSDYVFGDYSSGGNAREKSRLLMKEYSDQSPDVDRYKTYKKVITSLSLTNPHQVIKSKEVDILGALSLVNCKMYETSLTHWVGEPLISRSVPSGGSRHPIETYLVVKNKAIGFGSGTYHLNFGELRLDQVSSYMGIDCDAKLIFTAMVKRNMYRYREPRTMRSIHMDCGHLIENNARMLSFLGFKCELAFEDEKEILDHIEVDDFWEPYMATLRININE